MTCIIRNLWLLITKAGSLWVAWIDSYVLNGRTLWQVSPTQNCSWSWKRLLGLRTITQGFVELKNGVECWKFPGNSYKTTAI